MQQSNFQTEWESTRLCQYSAPCSDRPFSSLRGSWGVSTTTPQPAARPKPWGTGSEARGRTFSRWSRCWSAAATAPRRYLAAAKKKWGDGRSGRASPPPPGRTAGAGPRCPPEGSWSAPRTPWSLGERQRARRGLRQRRSSGEKRGQTSAATAGRGPHRPGTGPTGRGPQAGEAEGRLLR